MVTEYGFSEKLGPLRYNSDQEEVFLGHSVAQQKNMADATAELIDKEVRRFVEEGEKTAKKILTDHRDDLEIIAKGLLEYETLSRKDIDSLLKGDDIDRNDDPTTRSSGRRRSVPSTSRNDGIDPSNISPEPQPNT